MSRNNFEENWHFGALRYRPLLDIFYKHYCYDGRFVCIGDLETIPFSQIIQRDLKTDIVIQTSVSRSAGVEEKVVAWPADGQAYDAFFLETRSCTNPGHESKGWMRTCQADLLLYAFEMKDVGLLIYILPFPLLQHWFWEHYLRTLPSPDYGRSVMKDENRTEGYVVPITQVVQRIPTRCFLVPVAGDGCREVKPGINQALLRSHTLHKKEQSPEPGGKREHAHLFPQDELAPFS